MLVSPLSSFTIPAKTKRGAAPIFTALAHEVRNPLSNINLALGMLNYTHLNEEQKQCLDIIGRASVRINSLISTLLRSDLAVEAPLEFHYLPQLLDEVLLLAEDRIRLKNVTVIRDYTATGHRILMDKEKMRIALTNIVINAIDAMSLEDGELKLVTRSADGLDTIEIHDNGIGISQENLKKIFKPFFTNKAGGMGLGLSATMDILNANHARVDVSSVELEGTCFTLSFGKVDKVIL